MDPFVVLADHHVRSSSSDIGRSALPHAPQQPYVERRRWLRNLLAAARRRGMAERSWRPAATRDCGGRPVRSPGAVPGG